MTTERWALVPKMSNAVQEDAGLKWLANFQHMRKQDKRNAMAQAYDAMIQASPGAALLAEVLAARDAVKAVPYGIPDTRLYVQLIAALDKLGPAQENAT